MTIVAGSALVTVTVDFSEVFVVHSGFAVFVAVQAGKGFVVARHIVADAACVPFVVVLAAVNRKVQGIVFAELAFFPARVAGEAVGAVVHIAVDAGVLVIGLCLSVRVTIDAGEFLAIAGHGVALGTVLPLVVMCAGVNREKLRVVIRELAALAGGVAGQAVGAVEDIAGHALVKGIGFVPGVRVAIYTGEQLFVRGHGVAFGTVLPLVVVRTGEDGEKLGVVVFELPLLTAGMALQAIGAVENVP